MTSGKADLHVHSTASDGTLTPAQLVEEAASAGLAGLGITDHDSICGLEEGLAAGERCGLVVVPGVEINTDYGKDELHMLGYYFDLESTSLNAHLKILRDARFERGVEMVKRLNTLGINISMDRVEEIAGYGSIGRPHVARAIVEAGYTRTLNGAFGKYLVRGTPGYVARYKLTPFEAVQIIREAGGVAVLAHPGHSKHDELIPQLVDAGMQGIEATHTDHSSGQRRIYLKMAKKYGLIATGGSDFHGPGMVKSIPIGNATVEFEVVARLKELAGSQ